jgi:hypothetical protein
MKNISSIVGPLKYYTRICNWLYQLAQTFNSFFILFPLQDGNVTYFRNTLFLYSQTRSPGRSPSKQPCKISGLVLYSFVSCTQCTTQNSQEFPFPARHKDSETKLFVVIFFRKSLCLSKHCFIFTFCFQTTWNRKHDRQQTDGHLKHNPFPRIHVCCVMNLIIFLKQMDILIRCVCCHFSAWLKRCHART